MSFQFQTLDRAFTSSSSHCSQLEHPSTPTFALALFLVFGIFISYLPQHFRIIARRSSEGLSPYFVLLGTTSSTFAIANILTLPTSQADIRCCHEISRFACIAGLLGVAQVAVQWACFSFILFLFLIFFPTPGPEDHAPGSPSQPTWRDALTVAVVASVHFVAVLVASVAIQLFQPSWLQVWATVLGLCAATLACIQYLPQLYTTWKLQHVMSLSLPMMCIQTPGSFVFATSLAIRLGPQGWSAWGVYIVTGCLQGCLLFMGIMFEIRDRRKGIHGQARVEEDSVAQDGSTRPTAAAADETTPLIPGGQRNT